jgi:hypothetical protein
VETANVASEALEPDHSETMVSPSPEPTNIRMTVSVDAANAPAMIAPH